jgi:hypothetical protein
MRNLGSRAAIHTGRPAHQRKATETAIIEMVLQRGDMRL